MVRGVGDAEGIATLLRARASPFHYLQLLPAIAAAEERAGTRRLRRRTCESSRGNGFSTGRICGDAGACASIDERAATRDTFDGVAETQAARGAKDAQAEEECAGANAVAVRRVWRAVESVLAGAVLRFQRL